MYSRRNDMGSYKYAYKPKGKGYTVYRTGTSHKKKSAPKSDFLGDVAAKAVTGFLKTILK